MSSSREKISSSPPGFQPRRAIKLKTRFWKVPFLPVIFDELKGIGITFRQLLPVSELMIKCHVTETLGASHAKRFIDHELFWGVVMWSSPRMTWDLHIVVIDDNGKDYKLGSHLFFGWPSPHRYCHLQIRYRLWPCHAICRYPTHCQNEPSGIIPAASRSACQAAFSSSLMPRYSLM